MAEEVKAKRARKSLTTEEKIAEAKKKVESDKLAVKKMADKQKNSEKELKALQLKLKLEKCEHILSAIENNGMSIDEAVKVIEKAAPMKK